MNYSDLRYDQDVISSLKVIWHYMKLNSTNLNKDEGKKLMQNLIPEPEEINSREIFSEIGSRSLS